VSKSKLSGLIEWSLFHINIPFLIIIKSATKLITLNKKSNNNNNNNTLQQYLLSESGIRPFTVPMPFEKYEKSRFTGGAQSCNTS